MSALKLDAGESLEIARIGSLKSAWLGLLAETSTIEVDLGRVGQIDTAGLQFLIALKRQATENHQRLEFQNTPSVLRQSAAALGVDSQLF